MNNKDIKDKAIFVVGLLAAFLAFSSFKQELSSVYLNIGKHQITLLNATLSFIGLLTFSVYLYALDYVRYSIPKYQNFFIFRWIIPTANFFYSFAILSPIFILIMVIANIGPVNKFLLQSRIPVLIFDLIGVIIITIISFYNAKTSRKNKLEISDSLERYRIQSLTKAFKLINNKFYGEAVIEINKTIENYLKERLLETKGYTTRYMPINQLLDLSIDYKIINKEDKKLILSLRELRNKAAHSFEKISKDQSLASLQLARKILENETIDEDLSDN